MEKAVKPQNLYIGRRRGLTALAGVFCLALAIFFFIVPILARSRAPFPDDIKVFLYLSFAALALIGFILSALNFRNLFFPFILTTDERGIYDYSGYFHAGFIPWENIEGISGVSTASDVLDAVSGDVPCVKIFLKDLKATYKKHGVLWKLGLFFSYGCIRIRCTFSTVKRREISALLRESLATAKRR